mmetsp:Transcript_25068/g.41296  ORF Transcript_25068/g.41296 Transcript_25068/m.41296 type:complete len:414 (-) Transcript_25068:352-1593(-)
MNSLATVADLIQKVLDLREFYFEKDRDAQIQQAVSAIQEASASVLNVPENGSVKEKAFVIALKGKAIYAASGEYSKEAEDYLSKAVKLDPSEVDYWNALGQMLWKKNDLSGARNCLLGGLRQKENKVSLRDLSCVLRNIGKGTNEEAQNVEESIRLAKEAVGKDIKDGFSWQVLGNAYLAGFFSRPQHDPEDLKRALKAYQQAGVNQRYPSPDLHFNRGEVLKYLEQYQAACDEFSKAATLDAALPAETSIKNIIELVTSTFDLVQNKGHMKDRKLRLVLDSLSKEPLGRVSAAHMLVPLSALQPSNLGKMIAGKVVAIHNTSAVPLVYVICDSNQQCVAVHVYNLVSGAYSIGDTMHVLDPTVKTISLVVSRVITYVCVRVDSPSQSLRQNGNHIDQRYLQHAVIHIEKADS